MPARPLAQRFWDKVDRRDPDECWPWIGAQYWSERKRYGQIRADGGVNKLSAHRVSAQLAGLEVPDGHEHHVHHLCNNSLCVNPSHLTVVSAYEHGCMHHPCRWTQEKIVTCIKEFESRFGVLPAATDWNLALAVRLGHKERVKRWHENDWPSATTVQAKFGSWSAAIEASGFPRPRVGRRPGKPGTALMPSAC